MRPTLSVEMNIFLNELAMSMPWAEMQQQQIIDVITLGSTQQKRAYKADQLKTFLKHLRAWLAAEIYADEANRLITQAVSEVDLTDAGTLYSAKSFL